MPIFRSRSNFASALLACCLGAACGADAGSPVDAGPVRDSASSGAGSDSGIAAQPDGAAGAGAKGDAAADEAGLDATTQAAPGDATVPGSDAAALRDATAAPVDAARQEPVSDAAVGPVDAAEAKPDAQAGDTGAALPSDAGERTPDAGSQEPVPDAGEPLCIERGQSCATGSCCEDSACVSDDEGGGARCLAPCEFPGRCDGCGAYCGAEKGPVSLHCSEPILLAKNGTYLGRATSNKVTPESVCNPNSVYGNSSGTYSIHNQFGTYGNTFSQESPYNPNNFDGPAIACPDEQLVIAYVNKAGSGFDDIDPDELCDWLTRNNFF